MEDSRMDLILKKLNGEDVELVPPMSRIEKIYFKLLGYDIELDPPQSRSEVLLTEYVNRGGGGDITVEPLSVTENDTYIAPTGKAYSPVTVNVSGGGGSSDFSIAHVTFINTAQNGRYYTVRCHHIIGEYMEFRAEDITTIAPRTLDVVLYKGEQYIEAWDWDTSVAPVITGDITYDSEEEAFIITGDGSISLVGTGHIM